MAKCVNFGSSSQHSRQLPANGSRIRGIRGDTLLQPKWPTKHTLTGTGSTRWTLLFFFFLIETILNARRKKSRKYMGVSDNLFFF